MTRLLALPTGVASRVCALCSVLVMLTGAAARAQSADPATPPPAPAQPSVQDEATGSCEPIGLTASGEIVFPFRCKDTVERQHAAASKPADPKPAVAAAAPAVQEKLQAKPQAQPVAAAAKMTAVHPAHTANPKSVAIHPSGAAPKAAKPAVQPVDAAHSPKNLDKNLEKSVEKTAEAKTTEVKTTEAKTDEAKTAETKSTEAKSTETKSAETTKSIPQVAGKAHERAGPPGCTQFQSYNAVSATYLGFDGQRHPCLEAAGQTARNQLAGNQAVRTQSPHKPSPADIKH